MLGPVKKRTKQLQKIAFIILVAIFFSIPSIVYFSHSIYQLFKKPVNNTGCSSCEQ